MGRRRSARRFRWARAAIRGSSTRPPRRPSPRSRAASTTRPRAPTSCRRPRRDLPSQVTGGEARRHRGRGSPGAGGLLVAAPSGSGRGGTDTRRASLSLHRFGLLRSQLAEAVSGGNSAVHEEVAAGNEGAVRSHQSAPTVPTRPGYRPVRPGRRYLDHAPIALAAWPGQFVPASGVMMMPIVLTRAPRFPQRTASAITRSVSALGQLVGVQESVTWSGCSIGRASNSSEGVIASAVSSSVVEVAQPVPGSARRSPRRHRRAR